MKTVLEKRFLDVIIYCGLVVKHSCCSWRCLSLSGPSCDGHRPIATSLVTAAAPCCYDDRFHKQPCYFLQILLVPPCPKVHQPQRQQQGDFFLTFRGNTVNSLNEPTGWLLLPQQKPPAQALESPCRVNLHKCSHSLEMGATEDRRAHQFPADINFTRK